MAMSIVVQFFVSLATLLSFWGWGIIAFSPLSPRRILRHSINGSSRGGSTATTTTGSREQFHSYSRSMIARLGTAAAASQDTSSMSSSYEVHWLDHPSSSNAGVMDGYYDDDDDVLFGGGMDDDDDEEGANSDDADSMLGRAIARGEAVVCIPNIATTEECNQLFAAAMEACARRGTPAARGRSRFSVSDPTAFASSSSEVVFSCEEILLRVMDYLDEHIPSIYETLFLPAAGGEEWLKWQPLNAQLEEPSVPPEEFLADTCESLRDLYMTGNLEWSEGEPALNVYETSGYFGAHKDHLALTVLMPLTSPDDFAGGGTGFWGGNRMMDENPEGPPTTVLKPAAGSALIFGGDVTHAGMPVENGYRLVFVCSFSTKTPASREDRLHGLQAPPSVSANFKGTL